MKLILTFLMLALASAGIAAGPKWGFSRIDDSAAVVAGYVYYTDAIGTSSTNSVIRKVRSSLRLVCSATFGDPILLVNWQDQFPADADIAVATYLDNVLIDKSNWQIDKNVIYTNLENVSVGKKSAKFIKLTWSVGSTNYTAGYNMSGFDLGKFTSICSGSL